MEGPVILFDGVCNLCNGWVDFVMRRDPHARLRFAALQGEAGRKLEEKLAIPHELNMVILVEGDKYWSKSAAALRILGYLTMPYPLLRVLLVIPHFVRDAVYDLVVRNRYHWFGKRETCRMPTPEEQSRFL